MRRTTRWIGFALLVLSSAPGCQVFHRCRPLSIETRDAETKQPIAGAAVKVSYPLETSVFAPTIARETTGADGIARPNATPYGRAGILVEARRDGYLSEQKFLSVHEVEAIEPVGWFEDVRGRRVNYVMEMFAGPAPAIELVVPSEFRGQIKVKVETKDDIPSASNQRTFRFAVPESGEVVAAGPAVLRHLAPGGIHVLFENGTPISAWAKDSALGYWLLKSEGTTYWLLVGTQQDFNANRLSLRSSERGPGHGGGGSGGKGGRRGRKAGASGDSGS